MDLNAEILTIQKLIYLLDDFHYKEFIAHLKNSNAVLPLKLAEEIRQQLPEFDSHEELCSKIYGAVKKSDRQTFNQLSSHTFKLSANLASNYPEYLHPNIQKIQWLVAEQRLEEANFLTSQLLEIADKINDFPCQIFALKFLSQQYYLAKDIKRVEKTDTLLRRSTEDQNLYFKIQSTFRNAVYASTTPREGHELEELKLYFEQYNEHHCASIRILSRFACQHTLHTLTTEMFNEAHNERIKNLRKEIQNNAYVVFPFMVDIKGSLEALLLNSPYTNVFAKETDKEYENLSAHFDTIKFWKNYLNIGELNIIMVQATKILSLYHNKLHLSNYRQVMDPGDSALLDELLSKCKKIIERIPQGKDNDYEARSVRMLYSALLILSGKPHTQQGLSSMESLLIDYQQVNLKASTDSIFLCLMFGYFAMKEYEKCAHSYKRYLKTIKGKLSFEGNHIKIQSYYYISQWLATGSKQYPAKLESLLNEHGKTGSQRTIWELIRHFELPIVDTEPVF